MRKTIKDVAKLAGVSTATVSRVINEPERVKPPTLQTVQQAIKELNFQPSQAARTMVMKKTKSIGLLVPTVSNEYWGEVSEVVQDEFWERGYNLVLCNTKNSKERERKYFTMLMERMVDGVIYSTVDVPGCETAEAASELRKFKIPIVIFDRHIMGFPQVHADHLNGALKAVEHLIRLGHRKIAYIGGPLTSPEREVGYRQAHAAHDLEVHESLIRLGSPTVDFGYETILDFIHDGASFTAAFCGNDLIAFGAMNALYQSGRLVPEDVAIVGYDDIHIAALLNCPLTTIRQPIRTMVKTAVDLLTMLIEQGEITNGPSSVVYPTELIVRKSCGAEISRL